MDKSPIFQEIQKLINKYKKYFKETDEDIKITERFSGTAAINPFISHNSSPRGLMMTSHISQALVLNNPEPKIIRTGLDEELGRFSIMRKAETDIEVIDVVKRYRELHDRPSKPVVVEYVIIGIDLNEEKLTAIRIPRFNRYHPYFGFMYNIDEEFIESLVPGVVIPKGKVLAWSNGYNPETGEYGFGINLNVVYMSIDEVGEDAIVISESAAKKLSFTLIENRTVNIKQNELLLNLYGDETNYKPFPDIDEKINNDSVLFAKRSIDSEYLPGLFSTKTSREFNPTFDKVTYMKSPNGKVVDIKVHKTVSKKNSLPSGTEEQLEMYADMYLQFYQDIIRVYERYNKLPVDHELHELIVSAYGVLESSKPNSKLKKMYRKEIVELYRVDIDVAEDIVPTVGFKLTDLSASKGVIVSIWPDENMPYDPITGERADVIMEPAATVSRLNISRLYERYFTAASRTVKRLIKEHIGRLLNKSRDNVTSRDVDNLTDNTIKEIFSIYVLEFTNIINNEQHKIYTEAFNNNDIESMRDLIKDTIDREFYIYYTIEDEKRAWEVVIDIENSKFRPNYGPVKYKVNGVEYTTKKPVLIAPNYIMLLNKIADGLLTCSSAKLNHFGLPIGVSKADKYNLPYRNTPVRTIGETEGRLYAAYGGRRFVAELVDRAASPNTHAHVYRNILEANKPGAIENAVDREKQPFGGHKGLELLNTLFESIGIRISYHEDTRRYIQPVEDIEEEILDILSATMSSEEDEGGDDEE